ncbi:hypothetical protein D9M69_594110 [compost metagenome]
MIHIGCDQLVLKTFDTILGAAQVIARQLFNRDFRLVARVVLLFQAQEQFFDFAFRRLDLSDLVTTDDITVSAGVRLVH